MVLFQLDILDIYVETCKYSYTVIHTYNTYVADVLFKMLPPQP